MKLRKWCASASFAALAALGAGQAPASLIVTIQPILMCNNAGGSCVNAANNFFEAAGDKIWAQAGINLVFLPSTTHNNTNFQSLNTGGEFNALIAAPAAFGGSGLATVLNMWFVNDLDGDPGFYGVTSAIGGRAIAIGWAAVAAFNGGIGRIDTIAHEIGHSLGLGHFDFGAGGADNLMTQGSDRTIPNGLANIFPDGLMLDRLTNAQIAEVLRNGFGFVTSVPEPSSLALLGIAIVGVWVWRRRRA